MTDDIRWCEHCRDHYPGSHYPSDGSDHMSGVQYGPFGALLAREDALAALVAAVAPLMDSEIVQPERSAWEFDDGPGGVVRHATLKAAYDKAREAMGS